ncbi:MAG: hypothetical protein Q8O54_08975, partial [Brevundimonas sp.]|nr:hypothetical protein [Brevundimonas sp.]
HAPALEEIFRDYVPLFLEGLQALGVAPPFLVSLAIQGVEGAQIVFDGRSWEMPQPLQVDDLLLPFSLIGDFAERGEYLSMMKPTLDALWNGGGRSEWTPPTSA